MEINRLFEKRCLSLLLLLYKRKRIRSADLMMTGANYGMVHKRALELQRDGVVISSPDCTRHNRINWELTPRGNAVVLMLILSTFISDGVVDYRELFPKQIVDNLERGNIESVIQSIVGEIDLED